MEVRTDECMQEKGSKEGGNKSRRYERKQRRPVRVKHDALMHHGQNRGKQKSLNYAKNANNRKGNV